MGSQYFRYTTIFMLLGLTYVHASEKEDLPRIDSAVFKGLLDEVDFDGRDLLASSFSELVITGWGKEDVQRGEKRDVLPALGSFPSEQKRELKIRVKVKKRPLGDEEAEKATKVSEQGTGLIQSLPALSGEAGTERGAKMAKANEEELMVAPAGGMLPSLPGEPALKYFSITPLQAQNLLAFTFQEQFIADILNDTEFQTAIQNVVCEAFGNQTKQVFKQQYCLEVGPDLNQLLSELIRIRVDPLYKKK